MLHIVLLPLGFHIRINREKTERKKCYVGLGISESFEDYHTRFNLPCGISEWCMLFKFKKKNSLNRFVTESIDVSAFTSARGWVNLRQPGYRSLHHQQQQFKEHCMARKSELAFTCLLSLIHFFAKTCYFSLKNAFIETCHHFFWILGAFENWLCVLHHDVSSVVVLNQVTVVTKHPWKFFFDKKKHISTTETI